jgi:hypothetical protein
MAEPISGLLPLLLGHGCEELATKAVHAHWDQDHRVAEVEKADLSARVQSPSVPCFGREAHLASSGDPYVTSVRHGSSLQSSLAICIVIGGQDSTLIGG